MKKVLLLDTSFSSSPLYEALFEKGFDVYVCGNNPDDYLARISPQYEALDYTDIPNLKSRIEVLGIDMVVPGCNDVSYEVCSKLMAEGVYSLVDNEKIAKKLSVKDQYRSLLAEFNIPSPTVFVTLDDVSFPAIVKPTDSFSGRGVKIVRNQDELKNAVKLASSTSRSARYIIEEHVEGQLCSHSAFLCSGKVIWDVFVDEFGFFDPYAVDLSYVNTNMPRSLVNAIRKDIETLANELSLADGLIHTQFIFNENSKYWLIEATRRCPGDLYSRLVELSTGFPYASSYVDFLIGNRFELPKQESSFMQNIVRHTLCLEENEKMGAVHLPVDAQLKEFVPLYSIGSRHKSKARVGVLFFELCNSKTVGELSKSFQRKQFITRKL